MRFKATLLFIILTSLLVAQNKPSQKWIDQKYSMFIHFGLYSVYGGVYEGEPVRRGYSEQIQSFAGIFSDWYGNTAREFNPIKWDPDKIVSLAKEAGMKSIVFTSKHHDGFCMYHSQFTDFNIVDATPYGRDLMKELANACKRGGIDFGVYYSLIDWHYPHAYPISSHNADPLTNEHYEYNLKQVEEIMRNYGEISEIWFDMGSLTPSQSKGLYELVYKLQPKCMISGRLGNDYVDFAVMADNEYPDYKLGIPWQTAASMFDETWSYRSWQERGDIDEKVNDKILSLIKVISRGGNYLLNIGPRGDGSVVEFEKEVLLKMGNWISKNKEAIYGTESNPLHTNPHWGELTAEGNKIYAFLTNIEGLQKIKLSGFTGKVSNVSLLSSGKSLKFSYKRDVIEVNISSISQSKEVPVIKIEFKDEYEIKPAEIVTNNKLDAFNSMPLFGHSSLNYYAGYKSLIGYNWAVKPPKRTVNPKITFTRSEIGRKIDFEVDGKVQSVVLKSEDVEIVKVAESSVIWGNVYRKAGKGVFGNVEEEENKQMFSDLNQQSDTVLHNDWVIQSKFKPGHKYIEPINERESIVYMHEIKSSQAQTVAVEVEGGNAIYIILNGEYVTAHFSPKRLHSQKEIVLLPLKKGINNLIIKYYNGFEKEISFSITPLVEWHEYNIKLPAIRLKKKNYNLISIRSADGASKVSPIRMSNIKISL